MTVCVCVRDTAINALDLDWGGGVCPSRLGPEVSGSQTGGVMAEAEMRAYPNKLVSTIRAFFPSRRPPGALLKFDYTLL